MPFKKCLLILLITVSSAFATTTIIPTDNSQANLRDAYRLALHQATHPWTQNGQVAPQLLQPNQSYFGEVPVYWSMDSTQYPGSFIIPDSINTNGVTSLISAFPNPDKAFSLTFTDTTNTIWILKAYTADTTKTLITWEYVYFEQVLVNVLNLQRGQHFQIVEPAEFVKRVLNPQFATPTAKVLMVPAFIQGQTNPGEYIEHLCQTQPQWTTALKTFLFQGGTIYCEGNAACLLESASLLPAQTVDLTQIIDGVGPQMLAEISLNPEKFPVGALNQIYTSQAPTIHDSLHAVARFANASPTTARGKPAILIYEESALCGDGRMIINVGLPAVGALLIPDQPQWQWVANALLLAFAERVDVIRSVFVPTDSLHLEPWSLPVGVETTFEVHLQLRNLWNQSTGPIKIEEYFKPYFDFVGGVAGPTPLVDATNHCLTFNLSGLNAHTAETITYQLKAPPLTDPRVAQIDAFLDQELNMRVSSARAEISDPLLNTKRRTFGRSDLWVRFLFEARLVADLDVNWKNILGHYFQPFKVFTVMENKERTPAVNTQIINYVALDVPVYTTTTPMLPIERTPPGQLMDLLRLGNDLDGDAATDGPDVAFKPESIFPTAVSVETVRVHWKNPWTGQYDDFDFDGLTPTDADSDGVVDPGYNGDQLRALKIVWIPAAGTEADGDVPGYQFYDPFGYWELWLDPPDEIQMAIGAAINDTTRFAVTDSIYKLDSFYYPQWERWMEHDSTGQLRTARLVKRKNQDYEGFALVDSNYVLKPTDVDYGWIPCPVRTSVFFLAFGGRGPDMTHPLTASSDLSTIHYKTIWGKSKTTPLRSPYTYYAPLPNPLQFEYISKSFQISDPGTGQTLQELPAQREADLTFNISVSTEYSLYWINAATPDNDGDGRGDGIYAYVLEQIPKGLGGYSIDLPRDAFGLIDTFAVADPPPTAVWETPFNWQIYWKDLRIPAALDDDNGDGIDDWLDDTGDRFFNPIDSAYLPDAFPPGSGAWLPGPDGEYGDDQVEALGAQSLKVFARFQGQGREGLLKINDGAWLVNEEIFGGPPWVQFSHVQQAWAVGHQIVVDGKPDPTFVDLHPQPVLTKFQIRDENEPHQFDILFDPWLKCFGNNRSTASTYLGLMDPAHQLTPDIEMPARLNRSAVRSITIFPGLDPVQYPGFPKQGQGLFVETIVELDNVGQVLPTYDANGNLIGACVTTHWYNVNVKPQLAGLGNSEIFGAYCAYPRPLVPDDDFRTFQTGWRFNPPPEEILLQIGNSDGSATIPEIQATRRGYFIFLLKIDPGLANGCYRIPFQVTGTARAYNDATGGTPLNLSIPEARFSLSNGDTQPFIIGEAEITDLQDDLADYVKLDPATDVRWTDSSEPTEKTFLQLAPVNAYQQDSTLFMTSPLPRFPLETGVPDNNFWLVNRLQVDVPDAGENIPLDSGLRLTYRDHFGFESSFSIPPLTVAARGAEVLVSKRLLEVNQQPVESGTFTLKEGTNQLKLGLNLFCHGTDIVQAPVVSQILGPRIELQASNYPPDATTILANGSRQLTWHLPDMIPGSQRFLNLTLGLAFVESQKMEPILICDTSAVKYLEYQSVDLQQIWYALDLSIDPQQGLRIEPENPNPGETVQFSAAIHRQGFAGAQNVVVRFFKTDPTVPQNTLGEITLNRFFQSDTSIDLSWQLPSGNAQVFDFYVLVDADSTIGELSEKNNIAHLTATAGNVLFIDQLINYPNPFQYDTEFIFTLGQPADITIKIYTLEGRLIRTIDHGPAEPGYNSVYWDGLDADGDNLSNGTYIYKIIAKNATKTVEKKEYVVKMR